MGPALPLAGAPASAAFEVAMQAFLAPTLRPGPVGVIANLRAHKRPRRRQRRAAQGCTRYFLPAYSPDLSPIAAAWATRTDLLRRAKARTHALVVPASAATVDRIPAADARGYCEPGGCKFRALKAQ